MWYCVGNGGVAAIRIAKKHGVKCVLNPAPASELDGYILDTVDLFTPNEHELFGIEEKENVIVTLGERGCLIKETGLIIPSKNSGATIDTTGAGDTFNGALSAMLACGYKTAKAAEIANKVASLEVTRRYAVSSIPAREEIKKIIQETEK